jgi:hypothetical protein
MLLVRLIKTHIFFILLLFFTFSFLYHSDQSFDQDLGRHLKLGEIIFTSHEVPKVNLFSYTSPDFPFINHHWLFEVIVYFASITIGLQALLVSKFLLLLVIASAIVFLAYKTKSSLYFSVSFIFLHLLRGRSELRPEIISFLFTVLTLYVLEKFLKNNSKVIYLLPLISLFWVNSHIYFPVGIFIQLIFLGDILFQKYFQKNKGASLTKKLKTLSIVLGVSIAASFVNPNFVKGALYPFTVFSNYGVTITENLTIFALHEIKFVNPDFLFYLLASFSLFLSIYSSFWRTKFSFKNIGLTILGLALATQSIRGFPYLLFISLPYVLLNYNLKEHSIWTKALNLVVAVLLVGEAILYLNGTYYALTFRSWTPSLVYTENAKPALDFVITHKLPTPIYNNFNIGSYIIYRGYPEYKVSVDGRPEAYPALYFTETYLPTLTDYKKFKEEEKRSNIKTVIFSILDQNKETLAFFNAITKDPGWDIVFLDQFMIVLVKHDVQQTMHLRIIQLEKITADSYHYTRADEYTNISTFLSNLQYYKQAKIINKKALDINPDSPAANKIMAYILLFDKSNTSKGIIQDYLSKSSNGIFW